MMRKLLASCLLLFVLVCGTTSDASAITVTVSSQTFLAGTYNYGGSFGTIKVFSNKTFIAFDGTIVPFGEVGGSGFFKSVTCSVASNTLSCPSFALPSTTDALDDQTARYTFVLYDSKNVKRDILFANLFVPSSLGSNLTFAQIVLANKQTVPNRDTSTYTRTETNAQIALAAGALNDASDSVKGRTRLSAAPVSSASPIALAENDKRVPDIVNAAPFGFSNISTAAQNATAFTNALAALPASGGCLQIPGSTSTSPQMNAVTITGRNGLIIEAAGQSVNITSSAAVVGGVQLLFINCKNIVIRDVRFSGNVSFPPAALIESRVSAPRTLDAFELHLDNVYFGSDTSGSAVDGVKFTGDATPGACSNGTYGCDQNNEQAQLLGCTWTNLTGAGVSIQGGNSLFHKIIGGYMINVATAVKLQGGSFNMIGTSLANLTNYQFDFLTPTGATGYTHPSFVTNVNTESCARILRTTSAANIEISFSQYDNLGTTSGVNVIDFQSAGGVFRSIHSKFQSGGTGGAIATFAATTLADITSTYWEIQTNTFSGTLNSHGNTGGRLMETAYLRGVRAAAVTSAYTTTLNDDVIPLNPTGGSFNVTLLTTYPIGKRLTFKMIYNGVNTVTISHATGAIDGAANLVLAASGSGIYRGVTLIFQGSGQWLIESQY
jgi:hypothetical protein